MAAAPDFRVLFEGAPALLLVLAPDEAATIVAASDAYLQATMTRREAIVGRTLFEVFSRNPGDQQARAEKSMRASLERVRSLKVTDRMPVGKYDIPRPESEGGGYDERYWSPVNAPVLSPDGEVLYVVHRIEDVTDLHRREEVMGLELARARTALFGDIFETVSEPTLLVAADAGSGHLLTANPAAAKYLARKPAELIGRSVDEVLRGSAGQRIVAALAKVLREARREDLEIFEVGDDGPRLRRVSLSPAVTLADGSASHAVIVLHDRTAEQLAVESARASEARLRKIIDLIPVHINVRDLEGRYLLANRMTADIFDMTPDQLAGKSLSELGSKIGDTEEMRRRDRETIAAGGVSVYADQRLTVRGEERIYHMLKVPYTAPGASEPAVLSVAIDVTDARRTDRALRISEARYRTQFEHAPEAILTLDVDRGAFVEANEKAAELFGFGSEEMLRLGPLALSAAVQPGGVGAEEGLRGHVGRALAGELPVFEWMCRDASGREFPIEARLVRLPGDGENLVRVSLIDISDRKRAEEARARSVDLELQLGRMEESSRLKDEFLANMSHELRTPLNAVIGFASLLHSGRVPPESPEQQEFLGEILTAGRHLLGLIGDMLDLVKVESGKLALEPQEVDLKALVGEVVSIHRPTAADKGISVEVDVDVEGGVGVVVIDPLRVKQVLYNYLSNALKFTGEGGTVRARVMAEGADRFRLSVEDTGIGIAEADLGRLFVEFQQLDSGPTKRFGGTGLGLALTKKLVEAMGGTVGVASRLGKGSTFYAVLPRKAAVASSS